MAAEMKDSILPPEPPPAEEIPLEAYANEPAARINGHAAVDEKGLPTAAASPPAVRIRGGFEILERTEPTKWLLRPYLEELVLGLLYGDLGTLKSFLALHWALTLAARRVPALYMSAEGRGLERRIRGWCLRHAPEKRPEETMLEFPFYAIEQPLALPQAEMLDAIELAIEQHAVPPKLIVVDTLARYGGALDENKAQDVALLIAAGDRLRLKYGASVLFVHHTGHQAKDRPRGSYALMAATDAHFLVERPDPAKLAVTVTTGRLKDSESPPPFSLEGKVVDLGYKDEDGQQVTTVALQPATELVLPVRREPTGKNVQEALTALRGLPSNLFSMREAQEALRPIISDRRRRAEAITWLQKNCWLTTVGGLMRLEA